MKICTFLGHAESYDEHLYERIVEAVGKIVDENDEIDFWIYRLQGTGNNTKGFYSMCLEAVTEIKQHSQGKRIIVTKVVKNENGEKYIDDLQHNRTNTPSCLIDHVVVAPPLPSKKKDVTAVSKKVMRWVINKADYLVRYIYTDLYLAESNLLGAAQNKITYDVSVPDTVNMIAEAAKEIDGRDGEILKRLSEGKTISDIARDFGVSVNAIRSLRNRACFKIRQTIRKMMEQRRENEVAQSMSKNHSIKAALLTISQDNGGNLDALKQAVDYLVSSCQVTEFDILSDITHTEQVEYLRQRSKQYIMLQLVAITHYPDIDSMSRDEWRNAARPLCPPCHAVENINTFSEDKSVQIRKAIEALMEQCVFCICSLDDPTQKKIVGDCLANVKTGKILDLSKKYQIADTIRYD